MIDALTRARRLLERAERVLFVTGAGLSADSGLPTYRGLGGLYNGLTDEGFPIEMALSGSMLRQRPEICWRYLAQLGRACAAAAPNAAHQAIADFGRREAGSWVLTQNIDGFHRRSGFPPERLIEIHGQLEPLACMACARPVADAGACLAGSLPPRCPDCDGILRPPVVLFEEALPGAELQRLQAAVDQGFDLVIAVGTTAAFAYIQAPVGRTLAQGGDLIEVNPDRSALSGLATVQVRKRAVDVLPRLLSHING
ncbi:SIR2 family NAD-dependent protein deacylase [Pseudomonas sp. EpS/L25]|uniref:SIR2 family NAD-dependent protein deacylase n=1 Tax=Pseudomonas sp. EpS/L25 TaxID=1749078 RepID=UPI0007437A03|nr:NAD-dependent protein deacylase [Pseudomonas sp. EpS/L25]KUM44318.1 NAD-dependent deacetylase [Pseudomonas sp. EpS/L25]